MERPELTAPRSLSARDLGVRLPCHPPPRRPRKLCFWSRSVQSHRQEEKNDPAFAQKLAALCDLYVNDAFGSAHRAHASTEGMIKYVPQAAAGLLMEQELKYLGMATTNPPRPCVAILGGAKVSDKIEVIQNLG